MLKRFPVLLIFLFLTSLFVNAQQSVEKFVQETRYLLYLPEGYDKDAVTRWPLVIFLHGSGETGDSVEWVKRNGPPKMVAQGKKFPFILASPQAKVYKWQPDLLQEFVTDLKKKYRVDEDRIYLTGLSMGGFGTWAVAQESPGLFAAIVPLCGGGDTSQAWKLRNLPIWCFHGAKDDVVPPSNSINMIRAVRQYNPSAKLTIDPDAGHDCWTKAYNTDSLYAWLLAQKKFRYTKIASTPSALAAFAGTYVNTQRDTVLLELKGDSLLATFRGRTTGVQPYGKDLFFINENIPDDVLFERNNQGLVTGFVVRSGDRVNFQRVKKK